MQPPSPLQVLLDGHMQVICVLILSALQPTISCAFTDSVISSNQLDSGELVAGTHACRSAAIHHLHGSFSGHKCKTAGLSQTSEACLMHFAQCATETAQPSTWSPILPRHCKVVKFFPGTIALPHLHLHFCETSHHAGVQAVSNLIFHGCLVLAHCTWIAICCCTVTVLYNMDIDV